MGLCQSIEINPQDIKDILERNRLNDQELQRQGVIQEREALMSKLPIIKKKIQQRLSDCFSIAPQRPPRYFEFRLQTKYYHMDQTEITQILTALVRDEFETNKGWILRIYYTSNYCSAEYFNQHIKLSNKSTRRLMVKIQLSPDNFDGIPLEHTFGVYQTPKTIFREEQCSICQDGEATVLYVPCGHQIVCKTCHDKINKVIMSCPMCKSMITYTVAPRVSTPEVLGIDSVPVGH